jgi:hypothetical protein
MEVSVGKAVRAWEAEVISATTVNNTDTGDFNVRVTRRVLIV